MPVIIANGVIILIKYKKLLVNITVITTTYTYNRTTDVKVSKTYVAMY